MGCVTVVAVLVGAILGCLGLRRLLFLAAAAAPARDVAEPDAAGLPTLALVVPACNEAGGIHATLAALDAVAYPDDRLSVVLVDDRSDDDTGARLERWAGGRARTRVLRLERRLGKPGAVEAGLALAPSTMLVATCDADVRPRPDYFRRVAAAFADPEVGGAVGYLAPANALASPMASYAAVESWIHQLVTSAGKDRLDLNPPTLGGAPVFRRSALEQIGGFGCATSGDDVRATVALTRAGWRTRFVAPAVAETAVAADREAYWRQHLRWVRDVYAAGDHRSSASAHVPLARRIEGWALASGYADRVVLLIAIVLAAAGRFPLWAPAAYLGIAAIEVAWVVVRAGAGPHLPTLLARTMLYFPLDMAGAAIATLGRLAGERPGESPEPPRR